MNVTYQTIYKYEKDIAVPPPESLFKIAQYFNVTVDFLLDVEKTENKKILNKNYIRIPVLSKIPAGVPIEAIEDILDYEEVSLDGLCKSKTYFALKITGDSMYPNYLNGDVLIVCQQEDCENGQDAIVSINGHDATFKKVFKSESGITLQPLNNKYAPAFYSNKDINNIPVKVIGVPI